MKEVHTHTCVLGGGPSALLSLIFLREKCIEAIGIAEVLFGLLTPIYDGGIRYNLVPIFLGSESPLFKRITQAISGEQDLVKIQYSGVENGVYSPDIRRGSYAEFLAERFPGSNYLLILAEKHLGPSVFDSSLPEVQRKVITHYPHGSQASAKIGYSDGVSPYFEYIEQMKPAVMITRAIHAIDLQRRHVVTESHLISYERLISTVSLANFLRVARLHSRLQMHGGGAKFLALRSAEPIRSNQLIYDCDRRSPLYRAFVPRENIISAQVARANWNDPAGSVARRVQELFDLKQVPIPIRWLTAEACYPLEVSDYSLKANLFAQLQEAGVTLFGRFAEWEYRDLDELKWERLGEAL